MDKPISVESLAHDIVLTLLPKACEDLGWKVYEEKEDGSFYFNEEIIIEYSEMMETVSNKLKESYGENLEDYHF